MSPSYSAAALAASLALSACSGLAHPGRAEYAGRPGFECVVGGSAEPISIFWSLDESGRQVRANMEWRAPHRETWRPSLSILWRSHGAEPLRPEDGQAVFNWAQPPQRHLRLRRLRLELTADPDGPAWRSAPFAGPYERADVRSAHAAWSDLAAFARDAPRLAIVLRDRAGAIADRAALDPALFARAAGEIAAAFERMRAVNADFRNRCRHVDDLDPVVVLT